MSQKRDTQLLIQIVSANFLRIIAGCLNLQYKGFHEAGVQIDLLADLLPSDYAYILHHSYIWIGKRYMMSNDFETGLNFLKKALKHKKCEFQMEAKTLKLIQECQTEQKSI